MAAIFMGSMAGGLIGAGYLTAVHPTLAVAPTVASAEPASVATAPASAPVASVSPGVSTSSVIAVQPFRFAQVARGASDLQCLTEAVYFEARGEPERGQQAVAQVVLNRVRHPAFPKTICAVVHQRTDAGCQFSFACAPEPRGRDEAAWTRAQTIAHRALRGAVMRDVGDATHFESVRAAAFAGLLKVAQIGAHVFYRFGGHAGAAGMFHQTPTPSAAPRVMVASLAPREAATVHVVLATAQTASAPNAVKSAPDTLSQTRAASVKAMVAGGDTVAAGPVAAVALGPAATPSMPAIAKPSPAAAIVAS